jgi:hypothetical protein
MTVFLFISLIICFNGSLFIVAYIFSVFRIWASCSDRQFIMGDIEDKFIILLSTNILLMAVLVLFWSLVAKLTLCGRLYVVNNEVCVIGCFQWDNLCLWRCFFTEWSNIVHTEHIVPRCHSLDPSLLQYQDTIPHAVNLSPTLLKMDKKVARNMLSWSWRSIKLLLLHLVGFSILFYLHLRCTVKRKLNFWGASYCYSHFTNVAFK